MMQDCTLCPRNCHADRSGGKRGYCGQTAEIRAARAALHYWEEPCISGRRGSGAVFFSGCVLRCVYCQNWEIACDDHERAGRTISVTRLSEIFLELQEKGAHNINLVTPTHFVPQIARALERARRSGLRIPVIYNTGSYEKVGTLRQMDGLVDIYLPDFKYASSRLASRYSHAPDYFEVAAAAIEEMVRQVGAPVFEQEAGADAAGTGTGTKMIAMPEKTDMSVDPAEQTLMKKGVIVRHLVLPGCSWDSKKVVGYLHEKYKDRIYLSIMNQYTPLGELSGFPELRRRVRRREYEMVVDYALQIGVEKGFIQEGETARESFIPAFDQEGLQPADE